MDGKSGPDKTTDKTARSSAGTNAALEHMIRDALEGAISDLIKNRVIEKMVEEVVSTFALNDKDSIAIQSLIDQTTALHAEIRQRLNPPAASGGTDGLFSRLMQSGSFLDRLNEDSDDKREVARFVARRYFVERAAWPRISYFVQGSTIAYLLGEELAKTHNLSPSTTIHTNSIAMLLTSLHRTDNGRHSIWPFWSHEVDHACGAWLIPRHDQPALNALKGFFLPNEQTHLPHCSTAFLMPRYITLNSETGDSGFKYEMPLNALFADHLQGAAEVVVMATADRVHADTSRITGLRAVPALHDIWNAPNGRVTFVVAGIKEDVPHTAEMLRHRGFRVIWGSQAQWHEFEPAT